MKIEKFTVKSEFDGLELSGIIYEPDGEKKGVIQILHGMCEYKERYDEIMRFFAENGYVVACHDQRGHGDSVKDDGDLGYFYDKRGKAIIEDAAQVTKSLKSRYPDLPVTLYGHSMGSMVARCYLQKYDTLVEKAVISGSPNKNPLAGVAIALTKLIVLFKGDRYRSPMLTYLSTGKGNDRFKGEGKGAWLSRNRENIETFYKSPKNLRFTCNGFLNLFTLMKRTYTRKLYQTGAPKLKILFVSGSDDAVLGGKKGWEKTLAFMRKVGYECVQGKLYEGMRHEVHNELERAGVFADLLEFVNA